MAKASLSKAWVSLGPANFLFSSPAAACIKCHQCPGAFFMSDALSRIEKHWKLPEGYISTAALQTQTHTYMGTHPSYKAFSFTVSNSHSKLSRFRAWTKCFHLFKSKLRGGRRSSRGSERQHPGISYHSSEMVIRSWSVGK